MIIFGTPFNLYHKGFCFIFASFDLYSLTTDELSEAHEVMIYQGEVILMFLPGGFVKFENLSPVLTYSFLRDSE